MRDRLLKLEYKFDLVFGPIHTKIPNGDIQVQAHVLEYLLVEEFNE